MRLKVILLSLIGLGFVGNLFAQNLKIGYVNIEAILVMMPETKTMNQNLQTFQQKLGQDLQTHQQYLQSMYQEYQQLVQEGADEAVLKPKEEKIREVEKDVQKKTQESEQKLLERRQKLLNPIIEKIQKNLKELAADGNYDYILNAMDGNGVSIILHGPEEHNLTEKLLTKLGVSIPKAEGQ